jgi:hypothetical protein
VAGPQAAQVAGPQAAQVAGPQAAQVAGPQAAQVAGPEAAGRRPQAGGRRPRRWQFARSEQLRHSLTNGIGQLARDPLGDI